MIDYYDVKVEIVVITLEFKKKNPAHDLFYS